MNLGKDASTPVVNKKALQSKQPISWSFLKFKELSTDQLYDLIQMRNEVFVVGQNCVYQDADGMDKMAVHLLGYIENNLIAYARVFPPDIVEPGKCNFGRVLVNPARRKEGFGKLLIHKTLEFLREKWPDNNTIIHAQLYLERFYTDLGFKTVSEIYDEVGIPHIRMECSNHF